MRPFPIGSLALLAILYALLGTAALAGDFGQRLARPVVYDWSGLHVGVNGGGVFGGHDPSFSYENVDAESQALLPRRADISANGGLVGAEIGYDVQTGG